MSKFGFYRFGKLRQERRKNAARHSGAPGLVLHVFVVVVEVLFWSILLCKKPRNCGAGETANTLELIRVTFNYFLGNINFLNIYNFFNISIFRKRLKKGEKLTISYLGFCSLTFVFVFIAS